MLLPTLLQVQIPPDPGPGNLARDLPPMDVGEKPHDPHSEPAVRSGVSDRLDRFARVTQSEPASRILHVIASGEQVVAVTRRHTTGR